MIIPQELIQEREIAIRKALDAYKEKHEVVPLTPLIRSAFEAGFTAGEEYHEKQIWRKMIAGLTLQ